MASAEPEGAMKELESLQAYNVVFEGDKSKAFIEWAREHAEQLYPHVGRQGYVVPPLFVHKHSTHYDAAAGAEVLQDYQQSSPKGEKAHSHVAWSFSLLNPKLHQPLFIISGLEYDNMLKWVRHHPHLSPALPDAVENRGDIDIMLIHPCHGVVFIQVKAVGDNPESRTMKEIRKRIVLGGKQLKKDNNILRWVLQDWPEAATCHVTQVVALPNLTRHELAEFWSPSPPLDLTAEEANYVEGVVFLCKDDLPSPEQPAKPDADVDVTSLMTWWNSHVASVRTNLSLSFMKDVVSRYVGMLSAVEVYAGNNLRKEVRLASDAIDVCGMMFRRILLNQQQLHILTTPSQRCYLSGPPGSGKTVLLVLRGRQFVRQGGHVVVINMYRGAAGRAIGHFIRDSVARFNVPHGPEGKKGKQSKSRAKKKKIEERPTGDDISPDKDQKSPPILSTTPPLTATRADTPPPHKPSSAGKERGGQHTPPLSRKAQGTPPSSGHKFDAYMTAAHQQGTPPSTRKRHDTPPSGKQATPPLSRKAQTTPSKTQATTSMSGKGHGTPPTPRKTNGTPPTPRKAYDTPPTNRKAQDTPPMSRKAHDTPPVNRRQQSTQMDLSERVHSVDVDIDVSSFDRRTFENDIRTSLPADVKAEDVLFIVDEIYVKEYWSDVLDVLNQGYMGCHIWCAGLYSRTPPTFQQKDLLHVLRCPPLVQKVLHAVDWEPDRREKYRLTTDCSGIYTPGLMPLSVRHHTHEQVSITECETCASQLSSVLLQGLGLTVTAPKGSGQLSCNDVVMLVNIPRALYEPDERGFLDTTKQDFSAYMAYLSTCPLVATLRRCGIPVKVVEELPSLNLYDLKDEQVAVAWAYSYQGLENKVVIYLPGDTPWTPEIHDREIPAPGLRSSPREQPKVWEPVTEGSAIINEAPTSEDDQQGCADMTNLPREHQTHTDQPRVEGVTGGGEPGSEGRPQGGEGLNLSEFWWRKDDIARFSNWDKSNVFVGASRCLSQLIMLVP